MSIYGIGPLNVETFVLNTNPQSNFYSGSHGITGAISLYTRKSTSIKNSSEFSDSGFFSDSSDSEVKIKQNNFETVGVAVRRYFDKVNKIKGDDPVIPIKRLVPEYTGSLEYVNYVKSTIFNTLIPAYSAEYTGCTASYHNYNSINFVSSSKTPTDAALIYPNVDGCYNLTGVFTIGFHINVRNKYEKPNVGTIMHLSSNYVISVISGTQRDENNLVNTYGIQLQLSHSADIAPSIAYPGDGSKNDLTFRFDDILKYNTWHDVVIKWGADRNNGTGRIFVDNKRVGTFDVNYDELTMRDYYQSQLVIGNYYEGSNKQKDFFSKEMSRRYGTTSLTSTDTTYPFSYSTKFNHVGYFELHDIFIRKAYGTANRIRQTIDFEPPTSYAFYLPPFFVPSSSYVRAAGNLKGGLPIAVNYAISGSTSTPFNLPLSNGSGAHIMNLQNHLFDFVNMRSPYCLNLSASVKSSITTNEKKLKINDFFYQEKSVAANNLFILPCDDGNFKPVIPSSYGSNYGIYTSVPMTGYALFHDEVPRVRGNDPTVNSLLKNGTLWLNNNNIYDGKYREDKVTGVKYLQFTPNNPYNAAIDITDTDEQMSMLENWGSQFKKVPDYIDEKPILSLFDRCFPSSFYWKFMDSISNQIVIFNISNLYFGDSIQPGTFTLTDTSLTGSGGQVSITLKDNGYGGLYRANCFGTHDERRVVGNIFYNEGIVLIKNPALYFLGKDSYSMSFKGSRNVHVLKLETLASRNAVNLSSNPTFIKGLRPSADQIDSDDDFVYITGINFHDDNLNVVARVKLAQPIIKRDASKIGFKVKVDF